MRRVVVVVMVALGCSRTRPVERDASVAEGRSSAVAGAFAAGAVPAFPGAEGFGAGAVGGRGGAICRVTTLAKGGPGSLQSCFDERGRRTVIFDVSGVIDGPLEIKHGQLTVAGQTSPRGVTVRGGVVCDNVYDPNDCNDVVVRHVRFRGGAPDSFRIGGAHDVILDHCSFASADDENVEITRSRNVTIQYAMIAEPKGEHYKWGGVLINYSKDTLPLDGVTIHHSVWSGVSGRLPEMTCEDNGDGPGKTNCAGHVLSIELSNNVLWDVSDPIWFNRCTGTNEGNDCAPSAQNFGVRLNLVGNVLARRSSADPDLPLLEPAAFASPRSAIHTSDNVLLRGAVRAPSAVRAGVPARHPFPAVTYTPSSAIVALLARTAGALPRDKMDARLAGYLAQPVDARPPAWRNDLGVDMGDSFAASGDAAPAPDTDRDGVPDAWESAHGLDPKTPDANAPSRTCAGYTNLECWLADLAAAR